MKEILIQQPKRGTERRKRWKSQFRKTFKPDTVAGWVIWLFFPLVGFECYLAGYTMRKLS